MQEIIKVCYMIDACSEILIY